jgi:hypothetical protein
VIEVFVTGRQQPVGRTYTFAKNGLPGYEAFVALLQQARSSRAAA